MTNIAENPSVPSDQTAGTKQALTSRQQQVSPAQLLSEQQLPQSHATAAAQRTALAAIEDMASNSSAAAQVSCSPAPLPLVPMLLGPVLVTLLSELRPSPLSLIVQLQSMVLPLFEAE